MDIPAGDKTVPWSYRAISEGIYSRTDTGQYAPGVFGWGDVDGDGDTDIALSGDGDQRIFILRQNGSGDFDTITLLDTFGQAGIMQVGDFNNDGKVEIVASSFEENTIHIFEWKN